MSSWEGQSTNFMTNPFTLEQRSILKQKVIEQYHPDEDSQTHRFTPHLLDKDQDLTVTNRMPKKIKISKYQLISQSAHSSPKICLDKSKKVDCIPEEEFCQQTKKKTFSIEKQTLNQPNQQNKIFQQNQKDNKKFNATEQIEKHAEKNQFDVAQASAQILNKPSMRERFSYLLPQAHQKILSSQQQHLITIMSMMDSTIEYLTGNRGFKNSTVFFQQIKKNIQDALKVFIDMKHLEQLLYLDQNLYQVKWEKACDQKSYDALITLPRTETRQQRKNKIRETIVQFLSVKHHEMLKQKKIINYNLEGPWHQDFQPEKYEIPCKSLPPHPQTQAAEIRCFDNKRIEAIQNLKVRQLFKSQKQKSQIFSFDRQAALERIFSGQTATEMREILNAKLKQKQELNKLQIVREEKQLKKEQTTIMPTVLEDIAEVILRIYMGKNLSNIFKLKLLEIIKDRTNHKYGEHILNNHLQFLVQKKQIGFLKEIMTKDKKIIIQINQSKYKEIQTLARSLELPKQIFT